MEENKNDLEKKQLNWTIVSFFAMVIIGLVGFVLTNIQIKLAYDQIYKFVNKPELKAAAEININEDNKESYSHSIKIWNEGNISDNGVKICIDRQFNIASLTRSNEYRENCTGGDCGSNDGCIEILKDFNPGSADWEEVNFNTNDYLDIHEIKITSKNNINIPIKYFYYLSEDNSKDDDSNKSFSFSDDYSIAGSTLSSIYNSGGSLFLASQEINMEDLENLVKDLEKEYPEILTK